MSRWWLALALVLSIGINIGLVASHFFGRPTGQPAQVEARPATSPTPRGKDETPVWIRRIAHLLALEGDRRDRFVAIQQRFATTIEEARVARHRAQTGLRRALLRPEPDEDEIDRMLRSLSEANAAMERAFAENVLASRAMLGPAEERRFLEAIQRLRTHAERLRRARR